MRARPIPTSAVYLASLLFLPVAALRLPDVVDTKNLSVPFYLYKLPDWCKTCEDPLFYQWGDRVPGTFHQNEFPDVALYEVLRDHPWRVERGEDAKLFVVPGYFSASYDGLCGSHRKHMEELARTLAESPWFRRSGGRDHVISAFLHFMQPAAFLSAEPYINKLMVLHFENRDHNRGVVVPYGPVSARGVPIQEVPLAERKHSLFFMGQADTRYEYRSRRRALHILPEVFRDSVLIQATKTVKNSSSINAADDPPSLKGELRTCTPPGVVTGCKMQFNTDAYIKFGRQSNHTLVIEGDTPSTSRLYDAVQFGQVPIIISDRWKEIAQPFPFELPWDDFAVFMDPRDFTRDPTGSMKAAVAEASKSKRRELMRKVRFLLDWHYGGHCIGTAMLSDVGRRFLGMADLPPAWKTPLCEETYTAALVDPDMPRPGTRKVKFWLG